MGDLRILEELGQAAQIFTSIVLAAGAAHKLKAGLRVEAALAGMFDIPSGLARPLRYGMITAEGAAASFLLVPALRSAGLMLALGIWVTYLVVIGWALAAGRSGRDCGCTLNERQAGLGAFQLVRLLFLILVTAGAGAAVSDEWPGATAVAAAATLFLLYLAAEELAALQPHRAAA